MNLESKVWFSFSYSAVEKTDFRLSPFAVRNNRSDRDRRGKKFKWYFFAAVVFFAFKHSQFLSLTSSMNGYPFGGHCYSKLTKHFGITCDKLAF